MTQAMKEPPAGDELIFAPEPETPASPQDDRCWKVLLVDDEIEVHGVTRLALGDQEFRGRRLEFLSAYSGAEAMEICREEDDIAVILLDVVMETDHAGLDVVRYIRDTLGNQFVRIILRTGQPGQAPEHEVITTYDINDYKNKTELTREKLFTAVYTGISSYRDLRALDANRRGLEKVLEASSHIFELRSVDQFAEGVLEQITAILYLDQEAVMVRASGVAAEQYGENDCQVLAGTGRYRECVGKSIHTCIDADVAQKIMQALASKQSSCTGNRFVGYNRTDSGVEDVLYVSADSDISPHAQHLIDLFSRNVSIARENVLLMDRQTPAPAARP